MKNDKEDLRSALTNHIEELSKELQSQMQIKEACQKKIREIDTRCTQIVGAIHEMQKLVNTQSEDEQSGSKDISSDKEI